MTEFQEKFQWAEGQLPKLEGYGHMRAAVRADVPSRTN